MNRMDVLQKIKRLDWPLFLAILFVSGIWIVIPLRAFLPWSYVLLSISLSMTVAVAVIWRKPVWTTSLILIIVALTIWTVYGNRTSFKILPFQDSFQEFSFFGILLERGHFTLNMVWHMAYPNPVDPSGYPLLSILSVALKLTTGIETLHTTLLMTLVTGFSTLLVVLIFLKKVSNDKPNNKLLGYLGLVFLVASPDMTYDAIHFYHRQYSYVLCFLMLYFLAKTYHSKFSNRTNAFLLIVMLLILPLSHSYTPSVFIVFLSSFIVVSYFARARMANIHKNKKPSKLPITVPLIMFGSSFIWVFTLLYPCTFTDAFKTFTLRLLNPSFRIVEVGKYEGVVPFMYSSLNNPQFQSMRWVGDLLLIVPSALLWLKLLYDFTVKKDFKVKNLFLFVSFASFAPMFIINFFAGFEQMGWRYYALPFLVSFFAIFYGRLYKRRFFHKVLLSLLIVFLVSISFFSLFTHTFLPRHVYDSSIDFSDVGHPIPSYVNLKPFMSRYGKFEKIHVVSDYTGMLYVILDPEYYSHVTLVEYVLGKYSWVFGTRRSMVVDFVGLQPIPPYYTDEARAQWEQVRTTVTFDYNKVLDSADYSVYFND